jgi:hypothetical protein
MMACITFTEEDLAPDNPLKVLQERLDLLHEFAFLPRCGGLIKRPFYTTDEGWRINEERLCRQWITAVRRRFYDDNGELSTRQRQQVDEAYRTLVH